MSLFHRTMRDLLAPEINDDSAREILDKHLKAVNDEFLLDRKVIAELKEYYDLLKQARSMLPEKGRGGQLIRGSIRDKDFFDLIRKAHALIIDIENKIRVEYGEAHQFLE